MKPVECVWVCYRGVALQIGLLDKKQRMCAVLLEISHASFCVFEVYMLNIDGYFCFNFNCYAWNDQFCDWSCILITVVTFLRVSLCFWFLMTL